MSGVATRGGEDRIGEASEPTVAFHRAHQIHILHQRDLRDATDGLEHRPAHEDPLIPVRLPECEVPHLRAQLHQPQREPQLPTGCVRCIRCVRCVESKAKGAPTDARVRQCLTYRHVPARGQARVRVKKEDDLCSTVIESPLKLTSPARRRGDDLGTESPCPPSGVVATPAIDDDDLYSWGASARDGARNLGRFVEGGYHNRNLHPRTIARGSSSLLPLIDSHRPAPLPMRREFRQR